jgi:hypothetical protein
MIPRVTLRSALRDPRLLGSVLAGDSWRAWRVLLIAAMGEELTDDEREIFRQLTGREHEPGQPVEEFVGVVGRRGGKSRAISLIATYISGLCQHPALVRGERGVLLCIAQDQRQADVVLDHITENFEQSPVLRQLIEQRIQRTLRLTNRINIEVRAADFRALRGLTFIAVIADETAFWLSENSSNPDSEILNAVRPGLATTRGPLFMISSPYARRGELWSIYNKHYGPQGDPLILVAQAASRTMNPSLPASVVDRALEKDAAAASAEYLAQFRSDLEAFVRREAIEACIFTPGIVERPHQPGTMYYAFVDPSGGSADSMTMCVAHKDDRRDCVVVDALREVRPPFSPEAVVQEFAKTLQRYGILEVIGDRYAGEWPREQFRKHSITYEPADKSKSDLYVDLLPLLNSAKIDLLDHPRAIGQLIGLERRAGRSGKDSIDHGPGGQDDIANVIAGAAWVCLNDKYHGFDWSLRWVSDENDPDGTRAWRHTQLMEHFRRFG